MCQPPFTAREIPDTFPLRGRAYPRAILRLEGLGPFKKPVPSIRIKLATFLLEA
jgi:hypothetical protein